MAGWAQAPSQGWKTTPGHAGDAVARACRRSTSGKAYRCPCKPYSEGRAQALRARLWLSGYATGEEFATALDFAEKSR